MLTYKIPKKKTNKLFYKKWPYKIECLLSGSSYVVRIGLQRTLDWANGLDSRDRWIFKNCDRFQIKEFAEKYATFCEEEIQVRVEGAHFNIFVGDETLYNKIVGLMQKWVVCVTEPASQEELDLLLNANNKKVICNTIPENIFNFRIYIRPNKFKTHDRKNFLNWLEKYPGKVKVSGVTKLYLQGTSSFPQRPFIYVTDRAMANTVMLYLGERAVRTEEFITRSSINTILCQPLVKI